MSLARAESRSIGRLLFSAVAIAALCAQTASAQAVDKKIERTWKSKCASCHGVDGKGDTEQGKKMATASMATAEWQKSHKDQQIKDAILKGVKREKGGVKQEMDGYKDELSPEQIDGLVKYIRGLGPH